MKSRSHKTKQFLILTAKLLIVGGAFYFIYDQLANNEQLDWNKFLELLERKKSFWGILFLLSFSFFNRFTDVSTLWHPHIHVEHRRIRWWEELLFYITKCHDSTH